MNFLTPQSGNQFARWKRITGSVSAVALGVLFLVAGVWKLLDPLSAAERMMQSLIPPALSMPAALAVGISETAIALALFLPRLRRWGALLAGLMLVAFMVYMGVLYDRLSGEECNCFPWIRRVVGPMFFVSNSAMLALAALAGWWAPKPASPRAAAWVVAGVTVFAFASLAFAMVGRSDVRAPETILVDGKPYSLASGRVLLYFFDPECSHCDVVAREMAKRHWGDTVIIAVPTAQPEFAKEFLVGTGLKARLSSDAGLLRRTFKFVDSPYAAALAGGRQKAAFNSRQLDSPDFYQTLRELKFLE